PPRLHEPGPSAAPRHRPVVYPAISEDVLARVATEPEHLELLRAARLGSGMVIRLLARGRAVGALTLMNDGGRGLEPDTLPVAEQIAGRLASAIDNGRLFRERTEIARTLQASLLPPDLPAIAGVTLAARYLATGAALVRHTIRSAAITDADPSAVLAHANDVLLRSQPADLPEPRFCTALV